MRILTSALAGQTLALHDSQMPSEVLRGVVVAVRVETRQIGANL